jgi:plastocyanin
VPRLLACSCAALALGAATLSAGGCGSGAARAQDGRVTLFAREYAELPQHVEASPGVLRIELRNRGVQDHDLVVSRGEETVARLAPVAPGHSRVLTLHVSPGTYTLSCSEWRHEQLGEHGELTVR